MTRLAERQRTRASRAIPITTRFLPAAGAMTVPGDVTVLPEQPGSAAAVVDAAYVRCDKCHGCIQSPWVEMATLRGRKFACADNSFRCAGQCFHGQALRGALCPGSLPSVRAEKKMVGDMLMCTSSCQTRYIFNKMLETVTILHTLDLTSTASCKFQCSLESLQVKEP